MHYGNLNRERGKVQHRRNGKMIYCKEEKTHAELYMETYRHSLDIIMHIIHTPIHISEPI